MFASGRIEYAIVTVPSLEDLAIEDYAYRVAEGNLGDTEKDNGLLLLIAPNERQYRFEIGKGLEGTLNDAKIGRVGRTYLVPAFQEETYAEGVLAASYAIDDLTQGIEPEGFGTSVDVGYTEAWPTTGWKLFLVVLIFMALFMMFTAIKTRQSNRRYGNAAEVASWIFRGGGGGSGGFSGGGFGGGSFGGGGASGGW
jgi:uncharacterized protein